MKKVLVVYESKTGYTETYASWISEELGADMIARNKCKKEVLAQADLIIYGGSMNGGLISGLEKFRKLVKKVNTCPIIFFAVGIRKPTQRTLELVRNNNFRSDEQVSLFYMQGGMDSTKLRPGDKTMVVVYCAMINRQAAKHPEDEDLVKLMKNDGDYSDRQQIQPLIGAVRSTILL